MDIQYIKCPKCGTRNFTDDKVCGVCDTKLNPSVIIQQNPISNKRPHKKNYFVLILLFSGLVFLYYNIFHKDKANSTTDINPSTINYTLLSIKLNNKRAFNVSIRIFEKISDKELKSLAQKVKADINAISDKGVVFFTLPEIDINYGAWAAVDFNPDMQVRMMGQSVSDENKIKSALENITDYIGLWTDIGLKGDVIIRIRKDKKGRLCI